MNPTTWQSVLQFLEENTERLKFLEREAGHSLKILEDTQKYRKLQLAKTNLLIELPAKAENLLAFLSPELRNFISKGLEEFAGEARMAKKVDSVFYMSVLLYPDGDDAKSPPNGFEVFVRTVKHRANSLGVH